MFAVGLLAHQGGWDEALFVLVPIVVVVALLKLAQRRITNAAEAASAAESEAASASESESESGPVTASEPDDAGADAGETTH